VGQITKLKGQGKILGQTVYCSIMVNLVMALVLILPGKAFYIGIGKIFILNSVKFAHKLVGLLMMYGYLSGWS